MQYQKFGHTGLNVSRLCLGTMTFGLQTSEDVSRTILDTAADAGVNFIDTADVYPLGGDETQAGHTEEIVGRWLAGRRERFIIATKAALKVGVSPWDQGASRKHLLDAIDASLRRLRTDYVDLYQLHIDDPETPLDETLEALDIIVRSGKARYIGVSNFLAYRLARALGRADVLRVARFVSVQPRYNLLFRQIERELLPLAGEERLAVIPYNPLAGGLLTGKHRHDTAPPAGRFSADTVGKAGAMYQQRYWHEREFQTIDTLRKLAETSGESLTKLSVAWVLANPRVTSAILGASRPEQLIDTLAAADFTLDAPLKAQLDDATIEYRWATPRAESNLETEAMKKIALSGAAGQLGTILRAELIGRGIDLRSAGGPPPAEPLTPLVAGEDVMQGDLRDPAVVDRLLADVDVLIHLAGTSVERPLPEIVDNNLRALAEVYEGARRHRVRRIVFASSNHAIGMYPVDERLALDCAFRPDSFYGLSKAWGEALARMYWDKHGIESVCVRIGSCVERPSEVRHLSTWFGHEDLFHLIDRCIAAPETGFMVVWGVSNNTRSYWSNAGAERLGYLPRQNAEDYAADILARPNPVDALGQRFQGGAFASHDYTRSD